MDDKLKILFAGDASNYHSALAKALRRMGHDVTVASDGTRWMRTDRDIDLTRRFSGRLGGLDLWMRLKHIMPRHMSGYDVVSVSTAGFIPLRPERQNAIFNWLKAHNRSIFYTALGTDSFYVDMCLDKNSELDYNEFRVYGEPSPYVRANPGITDQWLNPALRRHTEDVYAKVDGATSVLYEYDLSLRRQLPAEKIAYTGIGVDTSALTPVELPERIDKVRLFLGRHKHRLLEKGTDLLEAAARDVVSRHPGKAELVIVENRPYAEYLDLLRSAHVVLDQIYSYTPATNSLLAMAYGLTTVSGGEEEYYRFIGEPSMRPVINVKPDYESIRATLEHTVLHSDDLRRRGLEGRDFVVKHNDSITVARRCLEFWCQRLEKK